MDKSYLIETTNANQLYQKYLQDFGLILRESFNANKDITSYILRSLQSDQNPEIARALLEAAFAHNLTTLGLIRIIVKVLYVTGHIRDYRHNTYHALKKQIDDTLKNFAGNKSELVQQKYPLVLERLNKENIQPRAKQKKKIEDKAAAVNNLVDNINRQYINFVKK
ncbi:hypothetical protein NO2_1149 [Candidatus Termititenax persephonae]|uniref:Uncharacterized protein n=1 Tax=Candidatus Termititenax persephonae TaxID=2218525 RepID=A0A388THK4_9BACT|nr:hypothetical protein NO2_1149 [Candidatus Termititenax persephonae]